MNNTPKIKYYSNKLKSYKPCLPAGWLQATKAFTLIELIVSMSIFLIIMGFSGVAYLNIQRNSDLVNQSTQLVSSIRQAQTLVFSGQTLDESNNSNVGIHFDSNSYTLFIGNAYDPFNSTNITTVFPNSIVLANYLPSADLIFYAQSGEVSNFDPLANTITITHQDGQSKTITINKLGVVDF